MKIIVLNGSPKGEFSITLQYFNYIRKNLKAHEYKTINIGDEIKKIEETPDRFDPIIEEIRSSDGILWVFPVYVFLAPSQLKRFIELVFERKAESAFIGKYATTITTSAHFFDNTAHNYIHSICSDLGINYLEGFSAEMFDLFKPEQRKNLLEFAGNFLDFIEKKLPVELKYAPVSDNMPEYVPGNVRDVPKTGNKKILLINEATPQDTNLNKMIETFIRSIPNPVEVVNISEMIIKGGCLGCCACLADGKCVYKDDIADIYGNKIASADAIIYAGRIRDRYLSARFKMFIDRGFSNGHRPTNMGKQTAYIISGPLRQISNLREILEAHAEVGRLNLVGTVTDEHEDPGRTTSLLVNLADQTVKALDRRIMKPATFLGVGGHKVFRDLVYSFRALFQADHEFYSRNKLYDFPQKDIKMKFISLLAGPAMKISKIRKMVYREAKKYMVKPFQKLLEK